MKLTHPEEFNIPLAEKVIDHVIRFPHLHNQSIVGAYDCHTPGCIAGWVRLFAGDLDDSASATAAEALYLTKGEVAAFFDEQDESAAIDVVRDYITQAKIAQHVRVQIVERFKELVNA